MRLWLWPSNSWRRSRTYQLRRLGRLSATPHAIALGCAAGTFASFTPLIGFHLIVAVAMAWLLRGNLIAAAIGTGVGNPLTFPFIWVSTFKVGQIMIPGVDKRAPATLGTRLEQQSVLEIWPIIKPMLLGSIPLGLMAGCIVYLLVYRMLTAFTLARQARLAKRHVAGEDAQANS